MTYDDAVLLEDPCPLREADGHLVLDTKKSPTKSRALRTEDLSRVGHLPLAQAAKRLGIAATTVRSCLGKAFACAVAPNRWGFHPLHGSAPLHRRQRLTSATMQGGSCPPCNPLAAAAAAQ